LDPAFRKVLKPNISAQPGADPG